MSSAKPNIGSKAIDLLSPIQNALELSERELKTLTDRLWVFSAYIRQPRKDDGTCNKTPFFERWDINSETSHLTVSDPRYASLEECQEICATLAALLLESHGIVSLSAFTISLCESVLARDFLPQSLSCVHTGQPISKTDIKLALSYTTQRIGAYEIPISYRVELNAGGRHECINVAWMKPLHINYKLRQSLGEHLIQAGVNANPIKKALDKIQVKAYCTDKVTMPPHFSNRDLRWATWPSGIQYASHYQCALIEMELMAQLYEFADAPSLDNNLALEIATVRRKPVLPTTRKCFVTGRILKYADYLQAANNPRGGKSNYHVGHILPLTRGGTHSWGNIRPLAKVLLIQKF